MFVRKITDGHYKENYYVKVWLKNLHVYKYFENLTLPQAQFKLMEHRRLGRTGEIHKKND